MQPETHFSALCRTKYERNWEKIVLWRTEPQCQVVEFRCITAATVGLDYSKQSSRVAMATLYRVGRACYPCFGPSGSWRTSLSLDTRELLVLPEELGCTSCCFGTESEKTISVKHKSRSWREVWTHLLSEKGAVVSCGPFAILYHARSPRIKRWAGEESSIEDHPFCFPRCFAVVGRQKIGPKGVHSRVQWMKWNEGLFPATRQREEPDKATGEPRWGGHNHFLRGPYQNGGKSHS